MRLSLDIALRRGAGGDHVVEHIAEMLCEFWREAQPGDHADIRIVQVAPHDGGPVSGGERENANPVQNVGVADGIDERDNRAVGLANEGWWDWLDRIGAKVSGVTWSDQIIGHSAAPSGDREVWRRVSGVRRLVGLDDIQRAHNIASLSPEEQARATGAAKLGK